MKSHRNYYFIVSIFLTLALMVAGQSLAANIDAKLPDNNNTSSFQVQDSANNVLMKVQSGGNVGIGTATPQTKLHAVGTSWFQGDNTPLPAAAGKGIAIGSGGDLGYVFAFDYGTFTPQNLLLNSPGGYVGIGTLTPVLGRLHVEGGNTGVEIAAVYGNSLNGRGMVGRSTNGVGVYGSSDNGLGDGGYGVYGRSEGGIGVYGYGGIGCYGESGTGYAGYFHGTVTVTGNLTAANFPNPSDARLKENVQSLGYGLPELMRLRPVSWSWIDQTQKQLPMGLIAQDVEGVIPELVLRDTDPTKPLGLNYMGLLPVMIKAMQEQQDIITALKSENTSLDARLKALEQALQQSRTQQ
jgi:hypothetical protein